MLTIEDIQRIHESKGLHFFSPNTMKGFKSKVLDDVYQGSKGIYFITSEKYGTDRRVYNIRQFNPDTGGITTAARGFETSKEAKREVLKLAYAESVLDELNSWPSPF